MNAMVNAFKRAQGVAEEKIKGGTRQSTGHRKLMAENIMAKKPPEDQPKADTPYVEVKNWR